MPPLSVAIDNDACVAALLLWSTLKPGDTDPDYFDGYTPVQRACLHDSRADEQAMIVAEIEGCLQCTNE